MCYNKIKMDDDKILELTGRIEETLGKEAFATISDTVGEILTGNTMNMKALADRDKKIATLQDRNDKLVSANGALLQKVPMGFTSSEKPEAKEDDSPKINLKDAFDSRGNFLH